MSHGYIYNFIKKKQKQIIPIFRAFYIASIKVNFLFIEKQKILL